MYHDENDQNMIKISKQFELICMKHAVKYLDNNAKDDYEDIVM